MHSSRHLLFTKFSPVECRGPSSQPQLHHWIVLRQIISQPFKPHSGLPDHRDDQFPVLISQKVLWNFPSQQLRWQCRCESRLCIARFLIFNTSGYSECIHTHTGVNRTSLGKLYIGCISFAKCSDIHKTLKTCHKSKYFCQAPQAGLRRIYSCNQSLHRGHQNTATDMNLPLCCVPLNMCWILHNRSVCAKKPQTNNNSDDKKKTSKHITAGTVFCSPKVILPEITSSTVLGTCLFLRLIF